MLYMVGQILSYYRNAKLAYYFDFTSIEMVV